MEVKDFVDQNCIAFQKMYADLDISYDTFIQTSDVKLHYPGAQELWRRIDAAGDLYKKSYSGYYCEGCEAIKLEKDLLEDRCPDHPNLTLQLIEEENYFFRLSKYREQIAELIRNGSYHIAPESRKKEILAFLEKAEDVSFSRQKSKMPRGIPVPNDPEHVMYVWCDALSNYLTGQGFGLNDEWKKVWPADLHVIGKDILRFHAAFWPAMLLSAQIALPKTLLAHGFLTLNGEKMSKSTGNVLDPMQPIEKYGRDALVFNLLYDVSLLNDGDFSLERIDAVYHSMLIGAWGNLINRVVSLSQKYGITQGVAHPDHLAARNETSNWDYEHLLAQFEANYLENFHLQTFLQDWYAQVQQANEFIAHAEPWKKYKVEETREDAIADLEFLLYIIKNLALFSSIFLTQGFTKLQTILGIEALNQIDTAQNMNKSLVQQALNLQTFKVTLSPEILYQKKESAE